MTAGAGPDRHGLPSPLLFHLAAAAGVMEKGLAQIVAEHTHAQSEVMPWAPHLRDALAELSPPDPLLAACEATRRLARMMAGIEAWQRHPHRRTLSEPRVIWRAGAARLLDFGGRGPVVLAVPSLINRAHILDLGRGHSLMRHLAGAGLRPLLLDWGGAGAEERGFDLTAYHDLRLVPALEAAARDGPVALLGYCMGGTLAAALAQTRPDLVARLVLMGAPWRFADSAGVAGGLRKLGRNAGPDRLAETLMSLDAVFGAVPGDLLQLLFAMLDPGLVLTKFRRFASYPRRSRDARRFVELEDWVNSPVDLPGPAAVEILVDWQLRDLTGRGLWRLAGARIAPRQITQPTLVVCAAADRIAPPGTTEPLAAAIDGAQVIRPATGHVGMIVGRASRDTVWAPLSDFLAASNHG
ncbi:MAG: alpha/beta fold hydrolase [Pseudomonadota bacterium]